MPFFIIRLIFGIGALAGILVGANKLTKTSERELWMLLQKVTNAMFVTTVFGSHMVQIWVINIL